MVRNVLMVAEKPSLADAISHHLSNGKAVKRQRALPVYEYSGSMYGAPAYFKVTSTTGHVFGCDFTAAHQNWAKTPEEELFTAPTIKKESEGAKAAAHLARESDGCDVLVLWLDCDREGENICFEVMQCVRKNIWKMDNIFRAKFSAITHEEISYAMNHLGKPNKDVSDAVECRQELDLKVGCAFTRFQTQFFQGKYGDLDASVVSYGPCQTPTLGFTVQRHDEILNFRPENYWRIVPVANRNGVIIQFDWDRMRLFDEPMARLMFKKINESKIAKVTSVTHSVDTKVRPTALNTVELLKIASRSLGLGPHHVMQVAEHLYTSGYISYPRTESTAYPPSFNLNQALGEQRSNSVWGSYVKELLATGITRPKAGKDCGDHPPITPMRSASPGELGSDGWRLYEYITRHFIATLSPDCKFNKMKISIELNGERFSTSGKVLISKGWTEILPSGAMKDEKLPEVHEGESFQLSDIRFAPGQTQPPGYLTEADLIGMMEKNGIGTDASIPTHINNILERNYASLKPGRTIEPTKLGVVLVHGYQRIDPELVLPLVRSKVEEYVTQIAEGKAKLDDVLSYAISLFSSKFNFFKSNIEKMDSLFGASFSSLKSSGKFLTRCGNCQRYLRHLEARPQRLYCQNCEVTFDLPQGGAIKQYANFTCPLDNFELVICHIDGGKSVAICPNCYNNPPFEDAVPKKSGGPGKSAKINIMTCADCRHPTCMHSLVTNYVSDCTDEQCPGSLAFVPRSTGKWKACCNHCNTMLMFPPTATKMRVRNEECEDCGARLMEMHFPEGKSPLQNRKEHLMACAFCDPALAPMTQEVKGRVGNFGRGRGGGDRGRGGRGGRGRGRGRGGRGRNRDPGGPDW